MEITDEVYPNQPLAEVVFEIRFPGDLSIECERHKFWSLIREDYPKLLVPHTAPDQALALTPYKFRKEDASMTVMLALNSFTLSTADYPGFKEFKKEILRLYSIFGEVYDISTINRVGWRYINTIPFVRDNGLIPLDMFLTLGFKVPKSIPEQFSNLSLTFESETDDGASIITMLETIKRIDTSEEAFLLDFDYGRVSKNKEPLKFDEIPTYLDEAHINTRQLFEEFITEEYRQYLRGDTI